MRRHLLLCFLVLASVGVGERTQAQPKLAYFRVEVQDESFVLAILDARTIQDAIDCLDGRKRLIPTGDIALGDGGFNIGWGWHLKPEERSRKFSRSGYGSMRRQTTRCRKHHVAPILPVDGTYCATVARSELRDNEQMTAPEPHTGLQDPWGGG